MDRKRSTKIRRRGGGGVHLPQEIIEQILQLLPVKSLLRFKCVSKPWRSLIESRSFVKKHLESSKSYSASPHWRLVTSGSLQVVNGMKKPGSMIPTPMDDQTNNHLIHGWVLGCCNGLLCILERYSYFLWNPATRICIKLPSSAKRIMYGFGWDEESGAYKVFEGMLDERDRKIGRVYSSKTNSWRRVECGSLSMSKGRVYCSEGMGVFARGKIHWITECGSYVEYLDLKGEVFGRVELPVEREERVGLWLREREGYLSVLCNNNSKEQRKVLRELREEEGLLDVWVMEECDWVKKKSVAIPLEFGGLTSTFLLCNGKEEKISDLYQNFTYVESLVSP